MDLTTHREPEHEDRRVVKYDVLHKWVATCVSVFCVVWLVTAYYIQSEDTKMQLDLQSQINVLTERQKTTLKVNSLVVAIDKQLSNIETKLTLQSDVVKEVRELRREVNQLKVAMARNTNKLDRGG